MKKPEEYANLNEMTKAELLYTHPGWQWCTAEGARRDVLRQGLKSTLREKLEWLEEAETLTLRLRASRNQKKALNSESTITAGLKQQRGADSA